MSNRFFDFAASLSRFVRRTPARAEDVNDRFDEVSHGMELVQGELDANAAHDAAQDLLKAPLANPAFTGGASLDGKPLATREYVESVAMSAAMPGAVAGMVPRGTVGGGITWQDVLGAPVPISANGALAARTLYHADCSAGPLALLLPPAPDHGCWVGVRDVKLAAATNNITLDGNGKATPGGDPTYTMDRKGETAFLVYDINLTQWVRA